MAIKPKYYETLYVVRPDIKEEELSKIQQKLNEALSAHEAEIIKSDKWAQRELAYEIKDYSRGVYYIIIFTALPGAIAELERHLRFYNTDVLRFITVAISDNAAKRRKPLPRAKVKASLPKPPPRAKVKASLPKPLPRAKVKASLPKPLPRAKVKASLPKPLPRAKVKTSLPKPLPRQKERANGITAR